MTGEGPSAFEVDVKGGSQPDTLRGNRCSNLQENLEHVLESRPFHVTVVLLVVIDVLIVTFQLLIDHDIIKVHDHEKKHEVEHALHTTSIAILAVFVAELLLKLWVFRLRFFKKYFEVFDGVIVVISFVLDLLPTTGATAAAELIMVARLWRVARIINGIILSVTTALHEEVETLKERNTELEKENEELKNENEELKNTIEDLKRGHPHSTSAKVSDF